MKSLGAVADETAEELEERKNKEAMLHAPSKLDTPDILPTHFALSKKPVKKATFSQKREIARLRERSMKRFKAEEYDPGWRELIDELDGIFPDISDVHSDAAKLTHPTYWRALGFSGADPNEDFSKYSEPEEGEGSVRGEDDWEHGHAVKTNARVDLPLSPLTSRYRGGILTQDCMLHFVRTCPVAKAIIASRRRGDTVSDTLNYNFAFVAMEMTRVLALEFHIILTRVQETPNFPIQPDMHVMMPFDVDWQDKREIIPYPMSALWSLLNPRDAFLRLHALGTLAYDFLYKSWGARVGDTYTVLAEARAFLRDSMCNSADLEEMESVVHEFIVKQYLDAEAARVTKEASLKAVNSVIDTAMRFSVPQQQLQRALDEAEQERRRQWRRDGRTMENEDKYCNTYN